MFNQNMKYNIKEACIFHLILVGILSILILSVKNRGGGGGQEGVGLLNGQNKSVKHDKSYLSTVVPNFNACLVVVFY